MYSILSVSVVEVNAVYGRLLIVEDEDGLRSSLQRYFEREGFTVDIAVNGRQASARLDAVRPDLVILDVQLPFVDRLRALPANPFSIPA